MTSIAQKSLRVLMLGWEFPPHISGGLGTACLGLTRGLAARGVDVTFVVPRAFGGETRGAWRLVGADRGYAAERDLAGAAGRAVGALRVLAVDSPLAAYGTPAEYSRRAERHEREGAQDPGDPRRVQASTRPLAFSGFYGRDLFREVARYAEVVSVLAAEGQYDCVHAHDWMTWPAGIAAARACGVPLVAHVHSCEWDRSGESAHPGIVAVEREGLHAAARVVCVSRYTASVIAERYAIDPAKIRVVHNAVAQRRAAPGRAAGGVAGRAAGRVARNTSPARTGDPLVLFLGRVTAQKGPGAFLDAAARVADADPRVRFVMAGSGDLLPGTIERAAQMGLARRMRFTGFLGGSDVARLFAQSAVYVMPSLSEPFGIAPLEAAAQGVPVILSRRSGVREVLPSALTVDPADSVDLADKILAVVRRPALREHLAGEAREQVRRMRWGARAADVRDLYRELVPRGPA